MLMDGMIPCWIAFMVKLSRWHLRVLTMSEENHAGKSMTGPVKTSTIRGETKWLMTHSLTRIPYSACRLELIALIINYLWCSVEGCVWMLKCKCKDLSQRSFLQYGTVKSFLYAEAERGLLLRPSLLFTHTGIGTSRNNAHQDFFFQDKLCL